MPEDSTLARKEKFHATASSLSEDFISLINSIISLYSKSVDAMLRSAYADDEDLKQVRFIKNLCAEFITDFRDRI